MALRVGSTAHVCLHMQSHSRVAAVLAQMSNLGSTRLLEKLQFDRLQDTEKLHACIWAASVNHELLELLRGNRVPPFRLPPSLLHTARMSSNDPFLCAPIVGCRLAGTLPVPGS